MTDVQFKEAMFRIEQLTKKFLLSPEISENLSQGKVMISDGGDLRLLCYTDEIAKFEEKYGAYVYHAIMDGIFTTLLYVGKDPDEYEYGRLRENTISAYIINLDHKLSRLGEFGSVELNSLNGTLTVLG